jgi:hypothetical protein
VCVCFALHWDCRAVFLAKAEEKNSLLPAAPLCDQKCGGDDDDAVVVVGNVEKSYDVCLVVERPLVAGKGQRMEAVTYYYYYR